MLYVLCLLTGRREEEQSRLHAASREPLSVLQPVEVFCLRFDK